MGQLSPATAPLLTALAGLAAVAAAVTGAAAQSGPDPLWTRQFGSGGPQEVLSLAPAGADGTFVAGYVYGTLEGPWLGEDDAYIARYDSEGTRLWITVFGSVEDDCARAVAPDQSGGAVISGNTGTYDPILARFDGNGNQVWLVHLDDNFASGQAYAVATDGVRVFVAGDASAIGRPEMFVACYDMDGNYLWHDINGTDEGYDQARAVALDGTGGVYLAGYSSSNLGGQIGSYDLILARYDSGGTQLWLRQLGTIKSDSAFAMIPADGGGVFLAGDTDGNFGGPQQGLGDAFVARFDADGLQTWVTQCGDSVAQQFSAIATDGAGGVFAYGHSNSGVLFGPGYGSSDMILARIDGSGGLLWGSRFGTSSTDVGKAVSYDGAGGAFVGGFSGGNLGGQTGNNDDAVLGRVNEHEGCCEDLWAVQLGTASFESAYAAMSDGAGGAFVAGDTKGSLGGANLGAEDVFVSRYSAAGDNLWVAQLGSIKSDFARALVSDGEGGMLVAGSTKGDLARPLQGSSDAFVARYDALGGQLWVAQFGTAGRDECFAAASDGAGGLYIAGDLSGNVFLTRIDDSGAQLWTLSFGTNQGDDIAYAACPDGAGGVYIAGFTKSSLGGPQQGLGDAFIARYNDSGAQLWLEQLGTSYPDGALALAPDGAGGAFMAGYTFKDLGGPNLGLNDAFLARYDGNGNLQWVVQPGTEKDDFGNALASDGVGGVFLAGQTYAALGGYFRGGLDSSLLRFDADGALVSSRQFGTGLADVPLAATPDGPRAVFVAGNTSGELGGPRMGLADLYLTRFEDPSPCPADPTNLTASEPVKGLASLTWLDNANNESGYRIRREQFLQGQWKNGAIVATLQANSTAYSQSPGQGFWRYQVQAFTAECDSAWTELKSVPAATPSGLAITKVNGAARLDWTDNSNFESKFLIQRQQKAGGVWKNQTNVATLNKNVVTFTNSPGAGTWRYRVRANSTAGNSAFTPWKTVTLP